MGSPLLSSRNRVNEKSACFVTVEHRDKNGLAMIPSSVRYRIDCLTTGQTVLDWTSATPATTHTITVDGNYNRIIDDGNERELKQLQVEAVGAGTRYDPILWEVVNLAGVT